MRCSEGRQVLDHAEPGFAFHCNANGERDLICFRLTDHVSYIAFTVGVRLMVDLVRTVKKLLYREEMMGIDESVCNERKGK